FNSEPADAVAEVIEHPYCGNRDDQTESRRVERFRYSTSDSRNARRASLLIHLLERMNDADDGPEQADKWRRRTDGCQTRKPALQFGGLHCRRASQRTFGFAHLPRRFIASDDGQFLQARVDDDGQMALAVSPREFQRAI